ncbi:SDR family oxidoreductase [Exiguobacterium artemiae]|uniref:SDR family oxidoreductase n=1 Tax=Exiguobacterium artemiae TaxID=340145 RepID=UPI00047AF6FC|nr:SDR family oxidoreductase [Exiguobacterium sibiricum]
MSHTPRIALVTGASHPRDIGTAICRKLAAEGMTICFTYWKADLEWIKTFQAELAVNGFQSEALEIDLSAPNAAERVLAHTCSTLGTPSVLINNAAHSTQTDLTTLDVSSLDAHYAVNVRSTVLLSTLFARTFAEAGLQDGRIVNLTSGQDLGPTDSTWMTDDIRTHLIPQFPFGRIGTPEDAARTIAFLVSEDAAWITGQVIHAEGGFAR